ncbi:MAG: phosphoglycerate kinase [Phycisphaerales bacterium]|nr:phosphoglycerate kinase [Phycisphaerales bacterium]
MTAAGRTSFSSIDGIEVNGRKVLARVDFNVPLDQGTITDDRRIASAIPTLRSVLDRGGSLVLMSHLGRPKGTGHESDKSLEPVAAHLAKLLERDVAFPSRDCTDEATIAAVERMNPGDVLLLENLRFHAGEKSGELEFANRLASYGDIYCNDAFGAAHRSDASMVGVAKSMHPKPCVAGLLLQNEIRWLGEAVESAEHPFVAILGGAKISDKLGAIRHLAGKVDTLVVGGAMAFTLLKALGHETGKSLVESAMVEEAGRIIGDVEKTGTELLLPTDFVCGKDTSSQTHTEISSRDIPDTMMGLDIGPESTKAFTAAIRKAKTVVWNGPMGLFEIPPFDIGTRQVAEAVQEATRNGAATIAGGGDTAAAVNAFGLEAGFSHISTGGGASLQMLEGRPLASLAVLDKSPGQ